MGALGYRAARLGSIIFLGQSKSMERILLARLFANCVLVDLSEEEACNSFL